MPTIEQVRAKIRRNFPNAGAARSDGHSPAEAPRLLWDHETAHSIVSSCGRFRISKTLVEGEPSYTAYTTPSPTAASRKITGPWETPKACREAVQDWLDGEAMQADLT